MTFGAHFGDDMLTEDTETNQGLGIPTAASVEEERTIISLEQLREVLARRGFDSIAMLTVVDEFLSRRREDVRFLETQHDRLVSMGENDGMDMADVVMDTTDPAGMPSRLQLLAESQARHAAESVLPGGATFELVFTTRQAVRVATNRLLRLASAKIAKLAERVARL